MNRLKNAIAAAALMIPLASCVSYNAYHRAHMAEQQKNWDTAVLEYEKALAIDPDNTRYRIALQRAMLEASRVHFAKGKSLRDASRASSAGAEQLRLAQLAATELELTVKLDTTNQFAAVELAKALQQVQDLLHANDKGSLEEMKKRAKANVTKAQPPQLNPASEEPISLSFPRETPVKDIYRALGSAFGINILFDQAVKDDRISIELRDVTAQQALERVMQAANHFYKVLDEKTIIVVPDNPQARRDYEDLVIRTFYLSNADAEQVGNVVRTMIEARNLFPLKALNAITIRDTADKVRIAEKIIEANDKAKAEVVVDVELLQLDINKTLNMGIDIGNTSGQIFATSGVDKDGKPIPVASALDFLRNLKSSNFSFVIPTVDYNLLKSYGNSELLANPELRISEGEKATLHIGQRIPVPVSTFTGINTGTTAGTYSPVTSFQYQDVGIKVSIEPRVHHNREVTLKLTVEVSNPGVPVKTTGQPDQPTFSTRTIESTIRLKDGETNFLAGLIQDNKQDATASTPFLGDIPVIGRLFRNETKNQQRTDLILTMTPHIIRIPDITEDDLAPMWVGTTNNLTFRGVSPRIESQIRADPFTPNLPRIADQFNSNNGGGSTNAINTDDVDGNPQPRTIAPVIVPPPGSAPTNPFTRPGNPVPPTPQPQSQLQKPQAQGGTESATSFVAAGAALPEEAALRLSPRLAPQPSNLAIKPGEEKIWSVVGMDLDGLTTTEIMIHFDPHAIDVSEIGFGGALQIDPKTPPVATINRETGTVRVTSSDGKPLSFTGGGEVVMLRVRGGLSGETYLVLENPALRNGAGATIQAAVSGGRARVQ
ncbi:MAG: secretin N-terminal domain-containing protein [Thermoanaerobaculia bacterium]